MRVVDLFCGIGGFSEGAVRAGHTPILAVDADAVALHTHELNHPNCVHVQATFPRDVLDVPTTGTWHLHGSPPCQVVSQANRRVSDEARADGLQLVHWFFDTVERTRPTTWSFEQVACPEIVAILDARRCENPFLYDHVVVVCSDYGVPQSRRRLIAGSPELIARLRKRCCDATTTMQQALPDTPTEWMMNTTTNTPDRRGGHRPLRPREHMRHVSRPSYTILARHAPFWVDSNGTVSRRLTVRECATLQTFGDEYHLGDGTAAQRQRGVGNAMPVELARRLMMEVRSP